jgi:ATP-dependent Zn protease
VKAGERQRLRAVAYHESGHAFAMWRGRLPFESITIEPTEDYLGRVLSARLRLRDDHVYNMSPVTRDRLERLIVSLLAAREAQRLFSRSGRYSHVDARDDRRQAVDIVLRIVPSELQARHYFGWLRQRAEDLVEQAPSRKAIEALAETLLKERRTLTGKEAVDVMRAAIGLPL